MGYLQSAISFQGTCWTCTDDCGALVGKALLEFLDELCDDLVKSLLGDSEHLLEVLDLREEILGHIGHGTWSAVKIHAILPLYEGLTDPFWKEVCGDRGRPCLRMCVVWFRCGGLGYQTSSAR